MICIEDFGPCPLCGENTIFIEILLAPTSEHFEVSCNCGLSFKGCDLDDLYSWNDRPELTCEDLATAADRFTCSVCGYSCASAIDTTGVSDEIPWLAYCPNCGAKVVES